MGANSSLRRVAKRLLRPLIFGREMTAETFSASQRVIPAKLVAAGYNFRHPELEGALRALLG